jgi:hypothetical protein
MDDPLRDATEKVGQLLAEASDGEVPDTAG